MTPYYSFGHYDIICGLWLTQRQNVNQTKYMVYDFSCKWQFREAGADRVEVGGGGERIQVCGGEDRVDKAF